LKVSLRPTLTATFAAHTSMFFDVSKPHAASLFRITLTHTTAVSPDAWHQRTESWLLHLIRQP
jgi:hypothetical protein